jgi:hypothetical protein
VRCVLATVHNHRGAVAQGYKSRIMKRGKKLTLTAK